MSIDVNKDELIFLLLQHCHRYSKINTFTAALLKKILALLCWPVLGKNKEIAIY